MTFRDGLLPMVDRVRAIPAALGTHRFTVTLVVRTWDGPRAGMGTATITETPVTVAGQAPHVAEVSTQDVVSGLYKAGDFKVGPLTPRYAGGGFNLADLEPEQDGVAREVFFRLTGPGLATDGTYFQKVDDSSDVSTSIFLVLRQTNFTP